MPFVTYDLYYSKDKARHAFHLRTVYYSRDNSIYWQFSCGCSIRMNEVAEEAFHSQLEWAFEGHKLERKDSFWGQNNMLKTEHFMCPKDPRLVERISLVCEQKKFLLFSKKELEENLQVEYRNLMIETFSTHVDIFENAPKKKTTKKISEVVRKYLEEENTKKRKEPAMTDDQLLDLFNQPTKKQRKNKQLKKPNKGKAPNNIRKTKKPAKL